MSRKQLVCLFLVSLFIWIMGNGLVPLLSVYAIHLGATSAAAGYFMGISYLALAMGALSAGWVSAHLQRKWPLLVTCLLTIPLYLWLGRVGSLLELTAATVCLWFLGGMDLALINILAGLYAPTNQRGRTFGLLGMSMGLGSIIGGLLTGFLADRWGYSGLFRSAAVLSLLMALPVLFLEDKQTESQKLSPETASQPAESGAKIGSAGLNVAFLLLLLAMLLSALANFIGVLGRSLVMAELQFSTMAITSTVAISGLLTLPVAPLAGSLSDRFGRRSAVLVGFMVGALGLVVLALAQAFWQFSLAIVCLVFATSVSQPLANAWTVDLVPPTSLSRSLARMGATGWLGGVLGFILGGIGLQYLSPTATFLAGAALFLLAGGLLLGIKNKGRSPENNG